jgi:hypothetical protein
MRQLLKFRKPRISTCIALAAAALVLPIVAQSAELAMLDTLTKGAWNFRIRDGAQQRICVREGTELIQIRHKQPGCSRFVVQDGPEEVIVQYTCRGNGYGRTSIRREANGLVQIDTQGIIDGAPFALSGEARHSGPC